MWVMGSHGLCSIRLYKLLHESVSKRTDTQKLDSNTRDTAQCFLVPANLPPKGWTCWGKIFENGNGGASVGHVVADDFDQDSNFTYSLVSGAGATHNDLFSIDANGSLIAQQSFDRK